MATFINMIVKNKSATNVDVDQLLTVNHYVCQKIAADFSDCIFSGCQ